MKAEVCGQPAHSTGGRTSGSGVHSSFRFRRGARMPACSKPARTSSGDNSPARGKKHLPSTLNPSARISFSITGSVSYTHLRAHETRHDLVCRLLLEKKKKK